MSDVILNVLGTIAGIKIAINISPQRRKEIINWKRWTQRRIEGRKTPQKNTVGATVAHTAFFYRITLYGPPGKTGLVDFL